MYDIVCVCVCVCQEIDTVQSLFDRFFLHVVFMCLCLRGEYHVQCTLSLPFSLLCICRYTL